MEKSTKIVIVFALFLATVVVALEGRELKAEPKVEPQTFPGFPGGPDLGAGSGSIPGFGLGLGQPAFGGGPVVPGGGQPAFGMTPGMPGGGFGGIPGIGQP